MPIERFNQDSRRRPRKSGSACKFSYLRSFQGRSTRSQQSHPSGDSSTPKLRDTFLTRLQSASHQKKSSDESAGGLLWPRPADLREGVAWLLGRIEACAASVRRSVDDELGCETCILVRGEIEGLLPNRESESSSWAKERKESRPRNDPIGNIILAVTSVKTVLHHRVQKYNSLRINSAISNSYQRTTISHPTTHICTVIRSLNPHSISFPSLRHFQRSSSLQKA
jgi:hypothetical protein